MDTRPPFQPDFTAPAAPVYAPVYPAGTHFVHPAEPLPSPEPSSPFDGRMPGSEQLLEGAGVASFVPADLPLTADQQAAYQRAEHRIFARSVLLGVAAMIVGALFHAVESSYSGLHFIYLAFVPGLLVGRAMKLNETIPGGRRYQVVAVALTYLSYLLASMLILLWALHRTGADLHDISLTAWGFLLIQSAELPFREITDGLMGWVEVVAMGVGIYMAWKSTRRGAAVMRTRWERRTPESTPSILGR